MDEDDCGISCIVNEAVYPEHPNCSSCHAISRDSLARPHISASPGTRKNPWPYYTTACDVLALRFSRRAPLVPNVLRFNTLCQRTQSRRTLPVMALEAAGRSMARKLVEGIAKDHGYVSEDVLGRIDRDTRRLIEEAFLKKDLMIASSVITYLCLHHFASGTDVFWIRLARNLYGSNARFIFELLQNADDNHYSRARADGAAPYVFFHVYPHRIIIECNEDGFTPENLVAICNVGKSSKTGAQGYIGEKGIGFKSVFMAAWKVYIQSGDFSFYFQHRKEDSGMGMITPVWQEPDHDLDGPLTRITLFLHETGDPDFLAAQRRTISEQFHELQATLLLFLKNIEWIDVAFYDDQDTMTSSVSYYIDHVSGGNRVTLKKTAVENGETNESRRTYHVTKQLTGNLEKNENRTYSEDELRTNAYANAEVILAFPLTDGSIPIIAAQDVFAFLPVRRAGFQVQYHYIGCISRTNSP